MRFLGALSWLILTLSGVLISPLAAQKPSPRPRIWAGLGFGVSGSPNDEDLIYGAMLQAAYQRGPHQFTLRTAVASGKYVDENTFSEYGALYGRTIYGPPGHLSASLGLSAMSICTGYPHHMQLPDDCEYAIGIPLVAEIALRPLPFIGLGAQAFANVNRVALYHGLVLYLQFGWLP